MFDPPDMVPYAQIPYEVNDSEQHRSLAVESARQSLVLLKNEKGFLPLKPGSVRSIAVIGPNADDVEVLLGNYNGTPSRAVTPFQGIRNRAGPDISVSYARGSGIITGSVEETLAAAEVVRQSDLVVACVGISQLLEGEEGQEMSEGISQGDRTDLDLPQAQDKLLRALSAIGKPMVVVLINGSALSVNWLNERAQAILEAWYPGEEGGTAIAEAIFGDYSPGGKLPVTFYQSVADLPAFTDYAMEGKTYRYFRGKPLFPFGFGLSYTRFRYSGLNVVPDKVEGGNPIQVSVKVRNVGEFAGDEVVQVYVADLEASVPVPIHQLVGFRRIHMAPAEMKTVTFAIRTDQFSLITDDGRRLVEAGRFQIAVGGCQPGYEDRTGGTTEVLTAFLEVPYSVPITAL
jgi:beta-glucosidase